MLAFLNESLKTLPKYLKKRLEFDWLKSFEKDKTSSQTNNSGPGELLRNLRIPIDHQKIKMRKIQILMIEACMYAVNTLIGLILMNIAMYYYAGHLITIILGKFVK